MMSSDNDSAEHAFESAISAALSLEALSEVESAEREIRAMSTSQRNEMYSQFRTTDEHVSKLIRTGNDKHKPHIWPMRLVRIAAALIAIGILSGITAIATAPGWREPVSSMEIDAAEYEGKLYLSLEPGHEAYDGLPSGASAPEGWTGKYYPKYIPEGYSLYDVMDDTVNYVNRYKSIYFSEYDENADVGFDLSEYELLYSQVNGVRAYVGAGDVTTMVIWDYGDRGFVLEGWENVKDMLEVARSVAIVEGG